MSPGRSNTGLTTPRHAEYQIIILRSWGILHNSSSNALRSSDNRWEGIDGLQFVGQAYPTHALLDSNPVNMLANPYG
ncbi:hypothetical protein TNCV_2357481 [Trichonephila clavipes]|nr:hypothetical protein TNCV_2357481 [Trichonephila clavipes]